MIDYSMFKLRSSEEIRKEFQKQQKLKRQENDDRVDLNKQFQISSYFNNNMDYVFETPAYCFIAVSGSYSSTDSNSLIGDSGSDSSFDNNSTNDSSCY